MHDKMLVTYVINLKRSTERMENMDRALKAMQVDYERVEGVDAQLLSEVLLSRNATPSVEYPYELAKGELACFYPENRGIYTQSDSPKKSSRNIWSLAVVSVDQRY